MHDLKGSFDLTLEQQFQYRLMEEAASQMPPEQMRELLLQASKQLMIKDNVVRSLMKSSMGC